MPASASAAATAPSIAATATGGVGALWMSEMPPLPAPRVRPSGARDDRERLRVAAVDPERPAHSFTAPANMPRMKLRCRKT